MKERNSTRRLGKRGREDSENDYGDEEDEEDDEFYNNKSSKRQKIGSHSKDYDISGGEEGLENEDDEGENDNSNMSIVLSGDLLLIYKRNPNNE